MAGIKLFLSLTVFVLLAGCASVKKKALKKSSLHYSIAASFIQQCKYRPALKELKKALKLDAYSPRLHYSTALVYFQFKEYDKAIKHLNKALDLETDFTRARVHLARALTETGQLEKALQALNRSLKDLTFNQPEITHSFLGLVYFKQKKFQLAEKHFSTAGKVLKNDCFVVLYHAKSLYFLNKLNIALHLFNKSKKLCFVNSSSCSPPVADSYYYSALIYSKRGQRQEAVKELKAFIQKTEESAYLKKAKKLLQAWVAL